MSLWSERCFIVVSGRAIMSRSKKKQKKRWKWSLIKPNRVRKHFWSDPIALEPSMIRLKCDWIRLWSFFRPNWTLTRPTPDHGPATVMRWNFRLNPVISVWEHTCVRSIGSDLKTFWVCTSTWAVIQSIAPNHDNDTIQGG